MSGPSFFTGYLAEGVGVATSFTENTSAGYARVPVNFTALNNGMAALQGGVTFPAATAVKVTQRALYDAPTGGNLIIWWNLKNTVSASSGSPDIIRAGALNHFYQSVYTVGGQGAGSTPVPFAAGAQVGQTDTGYPVYAGVPIQIVSGVISAATAVAGSAKATVARLTGSGGIPATSSPMEASIRQTAAGTYTLPSAPADGFEIVIKDANRNFATYNATIAAGSGDTLDGAANYVMNDNGQSITLVYDATNKNWDIT